MKGLNCWHSKFKSCSYSNKLIDKIILLNNKNNNKVDLETIKKAIYYAKKYHGKQKRETGELYYSHPLEVAYMVTDYLFDTDLLVTCILHDVLEDTIMNKKMIEDIFGNLIAANVESLTRIKANQKTSVTDTLNLLFSQKKEDLLLVKCFDRLHNLQTLKIKSPVKQKQIILETLKEFLPIVAHLGILELEKKFSKICIDLNLILQKVDSYEKHNFSFEDNYQLLFLAFESEKHYMYIQ